MSTSPDEDIGAAVNDWLNIVRRARLHATTKLIAFLMASYANSDGTSIYPGVALLAVQSTHGYRTVQRELKRLRDAGLIEAMPRTRRSWSTPYRLVIGPDLIEHVDIPSPATEKAAVDNLAARYRGRHKKATTARHDDGVHSGDCTPPDDTTARHGHLAEQGKAHQTLHVPPPGSNPTSADTSVVARGTGSASTPEANGHQIFSEEEDERRHQLDALAALIREDAR